MKANVEKIETNRMMLEVEVDSQELEKAADEAYRKLVHRYNIPGFRKGKVPRSILEKYVGTEYLYQEAADVLLPNVYAEALRETELEPIEQPELEIVQLEAGKPFIFRAQITVMPEVTLGEYKGLEVEKNIALVTDDEVENYLKSLQDRHARLVTLEEGQVEMEDTATIDFEGFVDDIPFEGGKGEDYPLAIGSNSFIPGFEEQLVGVGLGEEKDVQVTFPEEYHAEDLAGKDALFKVKVKEIRRKELSPLDDEFAKDISEFDTLEELREDCRELLEQRAENTAQSALREQIVEKAAENAQVEIPPVLVERQIDFMMNEFNQNLTMQGLSLEQFLGYMGKTEDELRDEYRGQGEKAVLAELVLEAIAKEEGIQASDEDVDGEFVKIAEQYQQDVETVRNNFTMSGRIEDLKHNIALDKTVAFLIEEANIKEVAQEVTPETEETD